MRHRHMFNTPQIPETGGDQGWNRGHQPYMPMARAGSSGSSSLVHPVENMTNHSGPFPSPLYPATGSNGYSSVMLNAELPHHQPHAPNPFHDHFPHQQPADGNFNMLPNKYFHHPSSSSLNGQRTPVVDGSSYNQTMSNGRGIHKRKSPSMPQLCDMGYTSRYYDVGSSSNSHLGADPLQERQNTESYHMPRYRFNNLSIGGESVPRNVRSRVGVELEPSIPRTHMPSNSVDFWGQSFNVPTMERNHRLVSPAGHGLTFSADSSVFGHDPNTLNAVNSYANGATSNRNPVPQNGYSSLSQSVRGIQSGFDQRSNTAFRASSSNFHPGQIVHSDERSQLAAGRYPSRYHRPYSTVRFRTSERHGITGISSDIYRSFTEEASLRHQFTPEGLVVVDQSTFSGSRIPFDQHMDLRLDIDNMSYEELLVLGERIGSVSTGLSEDLISKCLTESTYRPSDHLQDHGKCVICLEEYKNKDDVGALKCGHEFHVGCVRKWLSIKNSCPICKASAVDDAIKDKLST